MNHMRSNTIQFGLMLCVWLLLAGGARAEGIPEPSVVFYGTIRNTAVENTRATSGMLAWQLRDVASGWKTTFTTAVTNVLDQFSYGLEIPCEQVISTRLATNALNLSGTAVLFDCGQVSCSGVTARFVNLAQTNILLSARDRGRMFQVDLLIAAPCDDVDGNGLCDTWELQYFGYIGVDPNEDTDGDGLTNLQEYRAGTDPLDPQSNFRFLTISPMDATRVRVEWQSADGRYYSLLRYPSLTSTNFTVVQSRVMATGPSTACVDTNASPAGAYFYRVILEP